MSGQIYLSESPFFRPVKWDDIIPAHDCCEITLRSEGGLAVSLMGSEMLMKGVSWGTDLTSPTSYGNYTMSYTILSFGQPEAAGHI